MDIHKNARLTPHSRAELVRRVLKAVRAWLLRREPEVVWPAASTIGALFDREGLTVKRHRRRRTPPWSAPFATYGRANDVWCIDFKGWFLTGDGTHCEPLTLSDAHSRYLLRCQALGRNDSDHVWAILEAALREFGLPLALRSDNGPPFASSGAGPLTFTTNLRSSLDEFLSDPAPRLF